MSAIKDCFKLDHFNDKCFRKEIKINFVQIKKSGIKFSELFRYYGKKV